MLWRVPHVFNDNAMTMDTANVKPFYRSSFIFVESYKKISGNNALLRLGVCKRLYFLHRKYNLGLGVSAPVSMVWSG